MDKKFGIIIATLAAVIALAIVLLRGPLVVAIGVCFAGGLLASFLPHARRKNDSVGIR